MYEGRFSLDKADDIFRTKTRKRQHEEASSDGEPRQPKRSCTETSILLGRVGLQSCLSCPCNEYTYCYFNMFKAVKLTMCSLILFKI